MTLTIGRAASLRVKDWRRSGNRSTITGFINAASASEADARRQQLLGMVDNSAENAFPLTWSVDATVDGYYRVDGVDVSRVGVERGSRASFAVGVERVDGYSAPQFEAIVLNQLRTNPHGIVAGDGGVWGFPINSTEYYTGNSSGSISRVTADGTMKCYYQNASIPSTNIGRFYVAPASRYLGSAQIEVSYGGTYYPLVGNEIPAGATWRLSNGLVRLTQNGAVALNFEPYAAAGWDAATSFTIGGATTSGAASSIFGARVVRNSPEKVVIRLSVLFAGISGPVNSVDLALQVGSRYVEGTVVSVQQSDYYVEPSSATAATALTGGLRSTATDANGNRFVLASSTAQANNVATGRVKASTSTYNTWPFMIGFEVDIGSTGARDAAQELVNQYHRVLGLQQRIVAR